MHLRDNRCLAAELLSPMKKNSVPVAGEIQTEKGFSPDLKMGANLIDIWASFFLQKRASLGREGAMEIGVWGTLQLFSKIFSIQASSRGSNSEFRTIECLNK